MNGSFIKSRSDLQEELLLAGVKPQLSNWAHEQETHRGILTYMDKGKVRTKTVPTQQGNYYQYFEAVYQTMRHRAPAPVTAMDGYRTMLVMDAARKSVAKGRVIGIDSIATS